jgi:hypothetical protein
MPAVNTRANMLSRRFRIARKIKETWNILKKHGRIIYDQRRRRRELFNMSTYARLAPHEQSREQTRLGTRDSANAQGGPLADVLTPARRRRRNHKGKRRSAPAGSSPERRQELLNEEVVIAKTTSSHSSRILATLKAARPMLHRASSRSSGK